MIYKIIGSIFVSMGVYATYDMVFNMGVPILFSALIIVIIFSVSYLFTAKREQIDAVPVMIVKDAVPVSVDGLKGVSGGLG